MIPLTQDRLRDILHYDPETGIFTWAKSRPKCRRGAIAGRVNGQGYPEIKIDGRDYPAHRLAFLYMTGAFPTEDVDHANRVKTDNRWANLRRATTSQNLANQSLNIRNKSGVKGVCWDGDRKKWRAYINIEGRKKHLGLFSKIDDAAAAYQAAALAHFGSFAHAAVDPSVSIQSAIR